MTIQELKEKLLNTNYFIDNDYLDKYCELIVNNLKTEKIINETERHHILPKSYFKIIESKIDNSSSNTINLKFQYHILAHYFLVLSTMGKLNNCMMGAFYFLTYRLSTNSDIKSMMLEYENLKKKYVKDTLLLNLKKRGNILTSDILKELDISKIYDYYIVENHSGDETREFFKIPKNAWFKIIKQFDMFKSTNYDSLNNLISRITKDKLEKYYIEEDHSFNNTKKFFSINTDDALIKLLNFYNIPKKDKGKNSQKSNREFKYFLNTYSKQEFYHKYIEENFTIKEICNYYNICEITFYKLKDYYNIDSKRNNSKINYYKNSISEIELYTYYVKENHSCTETLKYFNIPNKNLLWKLLRIYNIKKK